MRHSEHQSSGRGCRFHALHGTRGLHRRPPAQRCPSASEHLRQREQTIVTTIAGRTKRIGFPTSYKHLTGSQFQQRVPASQHPAVAGQAAIAQAPIVVERDGSLVGPGAFGLVLE